MLVYLSLVFFFIEKSGAPAASTPSSGGFSFGLAGAQPPASAGFSFGQGIFYAGSERTGHRAVYSLYPKFL